jgi:hypothetical protein
LYLPPIQPYHPTTFLERGVLVPFTTPLLSGTRARPGDKHGMELAVPNPSGGRGVYILPWAGIEALCTPTLHDKQLSKRIAGLSAVTPAKIRRIARDVAAEGLAGEEAMEAARNARDGERGDRLLINYLLLMALVEQVNLIPAAAGAREEDDALDAEARAQMTVARVAWRMGRSPAWVASALEALTDVFANIGVGPNAAASRVPRLVELLQWTRTDVAEWSRTQPEGDQAAYAQMIRSVADVTLSLADKTLGRARSLINDMVGLLRSWAVEPEPIQWLAARPEWLLDGWEQICLIWGFASDDAMRRVALAEMAQLVPVLPREVKEWSDIGPEVDISARLRRMVRLNEDWRTGATVFDLIARNEHLRSVMF